MTDDEKREIGWLLAEQEARLNALTRVTLTILGNVIAPLDERSFEDLVIGLMAPEERRPGPSRLTAAEAHQVAIRNEQEMSLLVRKLRDLRSRNRRANRWGPPPAT